MSGFVSIYVGNPSSVLTRPANTTAYAQNDIIASSTTAASTAVPSVNAARAGQVSGTIIRVRLYTNVTTGWDASTFYVRLWTSAPTYTNGDNGAYAVATGAAYWLGTFSITLAQVADGAYGAGVPTVGNGIPWQSVANPSVVPTVLYWDLQYTAAAGVTPTSGQTFTLVPEMLQT